MAENKKIIFEVSLADRDKVLDSASKLRQQISELTAVQKELIQTQKERGTLSDRERVQLEAVTAQIGNLKKEYREVQRVASAYDQVKTREIGSYKQLNALIQIEETKLKNLEGTLARNAEGELVLTEEYLKQKKAVEELNAKRIEFDQGIKVGRTNVGNYTGSIIDARERIKELDQVIQSADIGSQKFKDAKEESDKLKLSIDQALGKVNEFGEREPRNPVKKQFDDAFESAVALSSSMELLTSLFGENSDVSEKLAQAMRSLAVTQAAANLLKAKGAILDTAEIINLKVKNLLYPILGKAVQGATVAQKAFNLALAASGIGLAILAVAKLVEVFKDFQAVANSSERETQKILNSLAGYAGAMQVTIIEDEKNLEQKKQQIELRKAEGAGLEELSALQQESFKLQEKLRASKGAALLIQIAENKERQKTEKDTEKLRDLEQEELRLNAEKNRLILERSAIANDAKVAEIEYLEEIKKRNEEVAKRLYEINFENMQLRIKTQTEGFREELLLFDLQSKKRLKDAKQQGLDLNLVELDIQQQRLELIQNYTDEANAMIIQTLSLVEDVDDKLTEKLEANIKHTTDNYVEQSDKRKQTLQEEADFSIDLFERIGDSFASAIDETGFNVAKFAQSLITVLLDTLEKSILASIAETTAKQISLFGFAGIPKAAILSGLITAAFESAKAVINKPVKYAEGGPIDIGGNYHSQGGTTFIGTDGTVFEAERDETMFIMNRRATGFLKSLSTVNDAFKGHSFYSRPNSHADGGFVQRRLSAEAITQLDVERAFTRALQQQKQPVLKISELKEIQDSVENSVSISEL